VILAALQLASVAGVWFSLQGAVNVAAAIRGSARNALDGHGTEYDVEGAPLLDLSLRSGRDELALGYSPTFTLRSAFRDEQRAFTILHNAFGRFVLAGPQWRLTLGQTLSFGDLSFATLRTPISLDPAAPRDPTAPRIDLIPTDRFVAVLSETTSAQFALDWTRRLRSALGASYSISGGRGARAQMLMPRIKTATAELTTDYDLGHGDALGAGSTLSNIRTSNGHEYWLLGLFGRANHQFSTGLSGQLILGATGVRREDELHRTHTTVEPTGAATLTIEFVHERDLAASLALGASLAPAVTGLTGELQQRAQGSTTFLLQIDEVRFSATADASQTLPADDPHAARIIGAAAGVTYTPAPFIDLVAEYRSAWQSAHDPMIASLPRQWIASVGVTLRAPTVHF
jgi:hypothetical protein